MSVAATFMYAGAQQRLMAANRRARDARHQNRIHMELARILRQPAVIWAFNEPEHRIAQQQVSSARVVRPLVCDIQLDIGSSS